MTAGAPPVKLERLCSRAVSDAGVTSCGVTMVVDSGQSVTAHATDASAHAVEDMQHTIGEGPGVEASHGGVAVLVPDLRDHTDASLLRWPTFASEATRAGIEATFAFPLMIGNTLIGAVSLYRNAPGALTSVQLSQTLVSADSIAHSLTDRGDGLPPVGALADPMRVHQAAGMAMVQLRVPIHEALMRMRAVAFGEGTSVDALAAEIVARRRRLSKEDR